MKRITLTLEELRNLFIAGSIFGEQTLSYNMDELDEVTALDFGEYMEENHKDIDLTN